MVDLPTDRPRGAQRTFAADRIDVPLAPALMAQAFLKALGFGGEIGVITLNMKGQSNASEGHTIQPVKLAPGAIQIVSEKWPFCFDADPKSAGSNRSILPFTSFNQDLNRLMLHVIGLSTEKAKVTWGGQTKEFTRNQLEDGINLNAEFDKTPFDGAFANLTNAVGQKQAFETTLVKNLVTHMRVIAAVAAEEPKVAAALAKLKKKLADEHAKQDANVRKTLQPVTHTIMVQEVQ